MTQIEHPGLTALPLPLNDSSTSTTRKCPQITQIDPDEFVLACSMRRGSGRPATAGIRWAGKSPQKRAFVPVSRPSDLRSSSAGLAISLIQSTSRRGEERQNRRASGTTAGEKTDSDGFLHPESSGFSPATGDYGSPVVLTTIGETALQVQHPPLCALCALCGSIIDECARSGFICVICGQPWVDG